jgi:hemerythrin
MNNKKIGNKISDSFMGRLEWDPIYSVGVTAFDNEHKVLFGFINDLRDSMLGRKGKETVEKVLEGLLDYTNTHFLNEEVTLYQYGYPKYAEHKAQHEALLSVARRLYVEFKAGATDSKIISAEIIAVCTEWLQEHIMKVDKDYMAFLKSKGVS